MNDIRTHIESFLGQNAVRPLPGHEPGQPQGHFTKAGVIPFLRKGDAFTYYVMKPQAAIPGLGAPPYQIGKGTRQYSKEGNWLDLRGKVEEGVQKESLPVTALREGIEELGLMLPNIRRLYDTGPHSFASATTGKSKEMWLFAAEMKAREQFLPESGIEGTTAGRSWLSLGEFEVVGRPDHHYILSSIHERLMRYLKE